MSETCSQLTQSNVYEALLVTFIFKFEQIHHIVLVLILLTLNKLMQAERTCDELITRFRLQINTRIVPIHIKSQVLLGILSKIQ